MIYDLEECDSVEEMLDNLMETADIKSVTSDGNAVSIDLQTNSGKILVRRFILDDHVEVEVV